MDAVSPLPAAVAICIAFITAMLIAKRFGAPPEQGRFGSIDGLRGYLAFFVFLHHSCIWYFYLRTGKWEVPPSNLYTNFGQSSVALFFMITAFLFFSKLIDRRKEGVDWLKLFVSRFMRLVPLYLFLMLLFFSLVAYFSNGELIESIPQLAKGIIKWIGFRVLGAPDLNGVKHLSTTVAGITWSLPYEWFFYLLLPLLALTIGLNPPMPYIALGIFGMLGLALWNPSGRLLVPFFGGIVASFLIRVILFRNFATTRSASVVILGCTGVAMFYFPSGYNGFSITFISIAFALIASGNSLFGVLTNSASRTLGEFAYGIYLLHSVTIFIVFKFVIGFKASMMLSPLQHWLVIFFITPIMIGLCFLTFIYIERPAMQSTTRVTDWLRINIIWRIKRQFFSASV